MQKVLPLLLTLLIAIGSCAQDYRLPRQRRGSGEIILKRTAYTASYNPVTMQPNWVAWRLTADHTTGDIHRKPYFQEDPDVPEPRACYQDYKGSGWTHGHMCPAADNKWSDKAMEESNLYSNICPQHATLNSGMWNRLEMRCRQWADRWGEIYIVCGPIFYKKVHETIGQHQVPVPEAFFKVILCMKGTPKAIGYVVKNNDGKKRSDDYVNSIDQVERITGLDFFYQLPDEIEQKVEAAYNLEDWKH